MSLSRWSWTPLTVGDWHNFVENGFGAWFQVHFLQQLAEATLARLPPTVDLFNDTGERECRQIQTQRFQHAHDDRLAAGANQSLAGSPRLGRLASGPSRALRLLVCARQ